MQVKKTLQQWRIAFGKTLLDKTTPSVLNENNRVKRILFLRQDGKIGDYIVSSFVFREIKKQHPDMHIGVVCTKKDAYLFEQNPYIDQCYYVKKKNIVDYIKCGLKLRQLNYDVVIDPTVFIRNRDLLLLRLINAKNYIGYKKSDYQLFNLNLEGEYHFAELYRLALEKIGIVVEDMRYDVPYDATYEKDISHFLIDNQLKNYLTINFFGAARIKKVREENIKKYLEYLTKITDAKPMVLLSYPEVTAQLKRLAEPYPHIFVHDTTSIFHTIALIRHCDQLISTDTSTVHIASGFNKPMIAIYRDDPIAITHWQPRSQGETHLLVYKENINELSPEMIKPEWVFK